jgi:DNA (cytosine-5)-methyltransferase 1
MSAYYNEIDPYAAQWLRNLITAGHIAPGDVDERSISDVTPNDLRHYKQCHFFAGIGVWSLALRRAGWADERPIWTGSCPCQPFSAAGAGAGFTDERHLWPEWFHLIEQRRPPIVFGEQVASKDAEPWLDLVFDDMEGLGYSAAAVAFPSASVGAPHKRDRTYFVADAGGPGLPARKREILYGTWRGKEGRTVEQCSSAPAGGLADSQRHDHRRQASTADHIGPEADRPTDGVSGRGGSSGEEWPGPVNGFWRAADWLLCRDGKWRPVEPGTFPLADGITNRVGRLRAYGNAINAQHAQVFIEEVMQSTF